MVKHVGHIADPVQRRQAAALRASNIGVWEYEPQTDRVYWDDRLRELWGILGKEEITYEKVLAQVHPDDRAMHDRATEATLDPAGDGRMDMVYRVIPRTGGPQRWIHAMGECVFENGVPLRLVGTVEDVTEAKEAKDRSALLTRELQHRVKNTLATATSIISLSRRGATDIDSYAKSITQRLGALGASLDALHASDWAAVDLEDLLRSLSQPFFDWGSPRVTLHGDAFHIPAALVMTFTIAFHELLTNASRHGALAHPGGRVDITVEHSDSRALLHWEETAPSLSGRAGPPGFGTLVLTEILPTETDGTATRDFSPGRFVYELDIPLTDGSMG